MPYKYVDLSKVRTYAIKKRENRVGTDDFIHPGSPFTPLENPELAEVSGRIAQARQSGRPVIWMIGGHVVKRGLAPILIDLMQRGVITHLASNGAATIHDFEIAMQGHTSEDVGRSLEDGSFGMAEETGSLMNQAIRRGARLGLGLGEALGQWIADDPQRFAYSEHSLLYNAYRLGIPYTVHVAVGTDIIHQHPLVDFAATGWASGHDFKIFTQTVCDLEGGVFCNFGSSVIGPEVFLKAISIARNLGNTVKVFTTANFDLITLDDYREPIGDDKTDYYYRPRKNIVNRPVALGGRGFHISGDHLSTIPTLYQQVTTQLAPLPPANQNLTFLAQSQEAVEWEAFTSSAPIAARVLSEALRAAPELEGLRQPLIQAYTLLERSFATRGTLYLAGNGGSMADALHISGELDKAFKHARPIPNAHSERLAGLPGGEALAKSLQTGLPAVALGNNPVLASAVDNDFADPHLGMAQELYALAHPGDVFLGISTSGSAKNVRYAASVARLLGLPVIALTGEKGGELAQQADIWLPAPAGETPLAQNWHIQIYHALCEMLEAQIFAKV